MSRKIIGVGVFSAAVIAVVLIGNNSAPASKSEREIASTKPAPLKATLEIVKGAHETVKAAASVMAEGPEVPTNEPKLLPEVPTPYLQELKQYLAIKDKVFMTEQEKILRKSFLNNTQMLMALGDYLQTPATPSADSEDARNVATDLLLEALQGDNKAVAEAALEKIITDNSVEDAKLDQGVRQSLAGTKAEVLYNWSAIDPTKSTQMQTWLPGPVSTKIWQNVQKTQAQNLQ